MYSSINLALNSSELNIVIISPFCYVAIDLINRSISFNLDFVKGIINNLAGRHKASLFDFLPVVVYNSSKEEGKYEAKEYKA